MPRTNFLSKFRGYAPETNNVAYEKALGKPHASLTKKAKRSEKQGLMQLKYRMGSTRSSSHIK